MKRLQIILVLAAFAFPSFVFGDAVQIDTTRDTGIIDLVADNNMGAHVHVPTSQANNFSVRRGLFYFDIASFIPSGSTINSVTFEFDVTQQGGFQGQQGATVDLHRLTTDWTEGIGIGPNGAFTGADATWNNATTSILWGTAGGDFVGATSGSVFVDHVAGGGGTITYSLGNAQLVSDLQNMLDGSVSNFGFLLKASDEGLPGSAMRITSREETTPSLGSEARLIVNFTIPEPGSAVVLCIVGLIYSHRRRV